MYPLMLKRPHAGREGVITGGVAGVIAGVARGLAEAVRAYLCHASVAPAVSADVSQTNPSSREVPHVCYLSLVQVAASVG